MLDQTNFSLKTYIFNLKMVFFYHFDHYFNEVDSVRERWTDNGLINLIDFDLM